MPLIPQLPGLDLFQGTVIHSHDYRYPQRFQNKTVVCLGAGPSGTDIALDLEPFAQKASLCRALDVSPKYVILVRNLQILNVE